MGGILLVAWCISRFARYSSSPGSLYSYAAMILPPWLGAVAAWSLLLAYIMGTASNIGAFYYYANVMILNATGRVVFRLIISHHLLSPIYLDRLARRKTFRARHAGDGSGFRHGGSFGDGAGAVSLHGCMATRTNFTFAWSDRQRFSPGPCAGVIQFRWAFDSGATVLGSEARNPH